MNTPDEIYLSFKRHLWLQSRGGRNPSDVISFKGKLFVEMGDGNGSSYFQEIPQESQITLSLNEDGYVCERRYPLLFKA